MSKPAAKNLHDSFSQQPNQLSLQEDRHNMSMDTSYNTNRSKSREQKTSAKSTRTPSKAINFELLLADIEKNEEQLKSCMIMHKFPGTGFIKNMFADIVAEAEELKHKIKHLRMDMIVKKNKEILARHADEMEKLVHAQNEEVQVFTKDWDAKIAAYKKETQQYEKEMKKKHEADLVKLEQDLRASIPVYARMNPQIINLRKVIDTLTYQKDFVQADELSLKCLMLEEEEYRKSEEQKEKKVLFILTQLAAKQKNELAGLKKRLSTGYFELIKLRETESQKFFNKLQTLKKSLEGAQQQETIKFEIAYRNFIPGERLQFKSNRRVGSITSSVRSKQPSDLSCSMIEELSKRHLSPVSSVRKRSVTPSKKDFLLKDSYLSNGSNISKGTKPSTLAVISLGRSVLNQSRDIYSLVPHTTTSRNSS